MNKEALKAELKSLIAQVDMISERQQEIRTEISRIEQEEREAERQKKIATATHTATKVEFSIRSSYARDTFVRETNSCWIDVLDGLRYKKSSDPTESEPRSASGTRWNRSHVRLKGITLKPKCDMLIDQNAAIGDDPD